MSFRKFMSAMQCGNLEAMQTAMKSQKINTVKFFEILKEAIRAGKIEESKLLINGGCLLLNDLTFKNELLHLSVIYGTFDLIKLLIEKGLSITSLDANLIPPFFKTVHRSSNDPELSRILDILLDNADSIHTKIPDREMTILHFAAEYGKCEIIPLLNEKKFKFNVKTNDGSSAFHIAARKSDGDFIKTLAKYGANSVVYDNDRKTPLTIAIEKKDIPTVKVLLAVRGGANDKQYLSKSLDRETLVYTATSVESPEILKLLFAGGLTANSNFGRPKKSALSLAIEKENVEIAKLLLSHKPDLEEFDKNGFPPLHQACLTKNLSLISTFLSAKNCDLNVKSKDNSTPLHLAVKNNWASILSLLLKRAANFKWIDNANQSVLSLAFENPHCDTEVLKTLLDYLRQHFKRTIPKFPENSVFLNYRERARQTKKSVLHLALEHEDPAVIGVFLTFHVSMDAEDENGNNPLELAVINGSRSIIDMFLKSRPNPKTWFVPRGEDGLTPLHIAVREGNADLVQMFLNAGVSPNVSKSSGLSPFHIAVGKNDKHMINILLKSGASADTSGRNAFETPLFTAARVGDVEIVRILSEASTTRSTEWTEGYLPLCIAAYFGHVKVVKFLLDRKVDPNATVGNYLTPLHAAAQRGHKNVVELLLERGAKVNVKRTFSTALLAGAYAGRGDIVHLLIDNGADVNAQLRKVAPKQMTAYEKILTHGSYTNEEIGNKGTLGGYSCMHFAVKARDEETVKLLIRNGANVNYEESATKATPISFAVENEDEAMVRHLLAAGANTTAKARYTRIFGIKCLQQNVKLAETLIRHASSSLSCIASGGVLTPLGVAVENNLEASVESILKSRIDPGLEHRKKPVIHVAVEKANLNIIQLLVKHKVDLNATADCEGTALLIAVRKNRAKIVEMLLNAGADIEIGKQSRYSTGDEDKPLGLAIIQKSAEIVGIILRKKKLVPSLKENCPFRLAVRKSSPAVVKTFLKNGAKIEMKDEKGLTPLFHAVDENNLAVVKYLLKKRASLRNVTSEGIPLIHFALTNNCSKIEILQLLIDYGLSVNVRSRELHSPLGVVLNKNFNSRTEKWSTSRQRVVRLLLENGANPSRREDGKTMLGFAIERDEPDLVKLLLLYGADVDMLNRANDLPLEEAIARANSESDKCEDIFSMQNLPHLSSGGLANKKYDEFFIRRFSNKYGDFKLLPFRESVRWIVKEIIRRYIVEQEILNANYSLISSEFVKDYFDECVKEIKLMRYMDICQGIDYEDILLASSSKLVSLVRNKAVEKLVADDRKFANFLEYAPMLMDRLQMGKERKELIDSSHSLLCKLLPYNWPYFIAEEIFGYLSNRDIRNIKSAISKDMFF